jgi:hypothetical protein
MRRSTMIKARLERALDAQMPHLAIPPVRFATLRRRASAAALAKAAIPKLSRLRRSIAVERCVNITRPPLRTGWSAG